MDTDQLYEKINSLPSDVRSEVDDFIDFLMNKRVAKRQKKKPEFGCAKGKIHIADDFDEPLDDFKDYR